MLNISPVILEGKWVRLEPLSERYAEGLLRAAQDERIWTYMSMFISTAEDVAQFLRQAEDAYRMETELPFAILLKETGQVVGSTRYMAIQKKHRGLEIGWTWLHPSVWRTSVNTECKWLLLRHAFEELGCIRVQLKTDERNTNSQRAIERIGGVREGILRNHMITKEGRYRNTVMFSIIDSEWPETDRRLRAMLEQ